MPIVNRRQALQHFGIASVTPLLPSETPTARKVVAVKPGENRYEYDVAGLRTSAACKLTSQDTSGASSIFELANQPKMGLHATFIIAKTSGITCSPEASSFKWAKRKYTLSTGAAIWAPRDIPHAWANNGTVDGRMILLCQPGGFERFFDELAKSEMNKDTPERMVQLMAKYGMEMLGPPLFAGEHAKLWGGQAAVDAEMKSRRAGNFGANGGMHLPTSRSKRECGR